MTFEQREAAIAIVVQHTQPTFESTFEYAVELVAQIERMRAALRSLRRSHDECEDGWYSCPKSEGGCFNEGAGDDCTCGADRANAIIDAALEEK